ncbi:NUDIX hydrolase [Aneurinibacillus tyrosinisolvens]|uniref:NUDIX hydrolase n=1 Tax=Aneurinibacillus tyrosinisolvens TaxID=1443435 RepID=UPI00063F302D|nr:NUDIX hydrolase [Aneurinibacillus tyrosinisolvens]
MRYKYCPKCGGTLRLNDKQDSTRPVCTECGFVFYQNPAVGVAAIVMREKKILLGKRSGTYRGQWCIPCGYVEWEEDVNDAAKREFEEETGLQIRIKRVYAVLSNFHNPEQHTVGIWFLAEEEGGSLKAQDDLEEAAFFSYGQLPELAFPTDKQVLRKLKEEGLLS